MTRDFKAVNKTCPKCSDPFLYVKDWGRAGALLVHGYDTDHMSGLRFPTACHVPEKVALGLMTMDEWRETTAQGDTHMNADYRHSLFGTDATPGPL